MSRARRGRSNLLAGAAAEEVALRHYEARGGRALARRWRGPEGEIDLVVLMGGVLVFVEVKRRAAALADDPVSPGQWVRLAATAQRYMMSHSETGAAGACRFDLAIVGPGGEVTVIENARGFDEQ